MNRTYFAKIQGLLLCCLLSAGLWGCSEKVVNNPGSDGSNLVIDIQLAPDGVELAADLYLLRVTGDDMDPVVDTLYPVPGTPFVAGQVTVPAGARRLFVLEGYVINATQGVPTLLYRGSTVASVVPGIVTTLNISLQPVAALLAVTPAFSEVFPGGRLNVALRVFNVPGLARIQADLWFTDFVLGNAVADFPDRNSPDVQQYFSTEGNWMGVTVEDNTGGSITNASGNTTVINVSLQPIFMVDIVPTMASVQISSFEAVTLAGDTLRFGDIFLDSAQALVFPILDRVVVFPDVVLDRTVRALNTAIDPAMPIMLNQIISTTGLSFADLGVVDLTGLGELINLSYLSMSWNTISDLSELARLNNLTSLESEAIQATNFSPLAGLVNMQYLTLSGNQITDIGFLSGLTHLRSLYLTTNGVSNISPLAGMRELESLYLGENQISDITILQNMTNLYYVDLHGNQITDIRPLVNNPGLGLYDVVDLWDNPAPGNDPDQNGYVDSLRTRGVTVNLTPPF